MRYKLKILAISVYIINILFVSCIDENITNISESLEINSSYSLPIGDVSYDINDYFDLLKSLNLDTIVPDTVQIDTIQQPPEDSLGLVGYNDTIYTNIQYVVDTLIYHDFDFSSLGEDLEKIKAITFVSIIDNDFPTETKVQVYFAGEAMTIIDSLFSDGPYLISPPDLDNEGIPLDRPPEIITTPVSESVIAHLPDIRQIIVYGYVKTLRPDVNISKFYSYYILSMHIATRIELLFNTSEF
jgi:hypothetical protein